MKNFIRKSAVGLLGVMLVFAFAACPADGDSSAKKSNLAVLEEFQALADDFVKDGVLGAAISELDWNVFTENTYLTEEQIGKLDFNSAASSAAVTFNITASSKAKVTYAVVKGSAMPGNAEFKNINTKTPALATNDAIYFKVVSESGKVINYYCVIVAGLGDAPSSSTGISGVTIGNGDPRSPSQSNGHSNISAVQPISYILPSSNMTGPVAIQLDRNNVNQSIAWATDTSNFTGFAEPASGNTLSAEISSNGLADATIIYIRVIAADEATTLYYAFKISIGNVAEIETLTLAGEPVTFLGEPGSAWDAVARQGTFDYQVDPPPAEFAIAAAARDGGAIAYAVTASSSAVPSFTNLSGTPNLPLGNGSFLYIKVTSINGNVTAYYKISIYTKASTIILYGQPEIKLGTDGGAPVLDALWDEAEWMFNVSRVNLNEMTPAFKFYNTVLGHYNSTGAGHTEGRAKAFWDDGGMYVYAEMTFHDYYQNQTDLESELLTTRTTVFTPPLTQVADNNAHLYDSLEIFTNERLQQYKEGGYGIQYRVAPSPAGQTIAGTNSRVSGNPPNVLPGSGASAISILRDSGKYYTWIRKDGEKELGYSIITYIPWVYKYDNSANQVYSAGKVNTTGIDAGPTVGVEFQLDAVTAGGTRDAILTWNGITGQSYNQVKNYGKAILVTGDLTERGITRGVKDPLPVTVTFDTNGGTPATIASLQIAKGFSAGSLFPNNPVKNNYIFGGWYDESAVPPVRYTANTLIPKDLTLTARWNEDSGLGEVIWSLADYIAANGYTEGQRFASSSTAKPLRTSSSSTAIGELKSGGIEFNTIGFNYSGLNLWIHGVSTGDLKLDLENKIYEIVVTGSIIAETFTEGETMRISNEQDNMAAFKDPDAGFISDPLSDSNRSFTIGGILPSDWKTTATAECIRIRSATGVLFRIDSIVLYDKGYSVIDSMNVTVAGKQVSGITVNAFGTGSTAEYLSDRSGYEHAKTTVGNRGAYVWFELDLGDKTLDDFQEVKYSAEYVVAGSGSRRVALIASVDGSEFTAALGTSRVNNSSTGLLADGQITAPQSASVTPVNDQVVNFTLPFDKTVDPTVANAVFGLNKVFLCLYEHSSSGITVKVSNIEFVLKPSEPDDSQPRGVIYNLQNDPDLASLQGGGGGTHTNGILAWTLSTGGSTTVDLEAKTVTTAGRGGTGQGIYLVLSKFLENAKPGLSYRFDYSGIFSDTSGGFGRLRLESSTGAILATGTDYNETTREFSLSHTMTYEQIAAITGSTRISFGNTGGGATNITYTGLVITEIKVLYDMQNDPELANFDTGGVATSSPSITFLQASISTGTGAISVDMASTPKKFTVTGRTGTSQGCRIKLGAFPTNANCEYIIHVTGSFGGTTVISARLRGESTSGSPSIGSVTSPVDGNYAFDISMTLSHEQISANSGGTISIGNSEGGNVDMTITGIIITEIGK